jgi:hypothetical protein
MDGAGLDISDFSDRVRRATGTVAEQLGCGLAEGLYRLIVRADSAGQDLEDLANDVINRVVRFDPGP